MDSEPSIVLHHHDHDHNKLTEDVDSHPHLPRLPIRDLRFEYSYIQSIQPYVELRRGTQGNLAETVVDDDSIDQKEPKPRLSSTTEVVHVKWGKVAWITTRDQIISPLLQGTFWALASYFLSPIAAQVGHRISAFTHPHLPSKEGRGIGWLRSWVKSLGFGTNMVPRRA